MRVGMNLLLWAIQVKEEHFSLLPKIKAAGYDGVEVPIFMGQEADYRRLGKEIKRHGLSATAVTVANADANPIDPDPAMRQKAVDRLKWALDMCAAVGGELLCGPFHSPLGVFSGSGPTDDEKKRAIEVLRKGGDHAAKLGVRFALEFLCRFESYFLTTVKDTIDLVDRINHPAVGMMIDTFHANIEEKDPAASAERCGKRLIHMHISENDRGAPGTGNVDWSGIFGALRRMKYDGWLTIEAFGRAMPDIAAATRVWRDLFESEADVYQQGARFIREMWARAG
ncbi:MAG: sugar phosphate isomerase/epimerase [Planctomycetota bacterium]|nr:sugar phosphate isomerase/epimerase [Planctomycetota bacterium]